MAYSALLVPLTLLPWAIPDEYGGFGPVYGLSALTLSLAFLALSLRVAFRSLCDVAMKPEKQLFAFSILYLFILFAALVAERWFVSLF